MAAGIALWYGVSAAQKWFYTSYEPRTVSPRGNLASFEKSSIEIFRNAAPSVAYISTIRAQEDIFGSRTVSAGEGSGFVWDKAGHIVTNDHVVSAADQVYVRFGSDRPIVANVIGVAPEYDLAVLRVASVPFSIDPLPLGSSSDLAVGQYVFAIGNPFGLERTLTNGCHQRDGQDTSHCNGPRDHWRYPDRCCDKPRKLRRTSAGLRWACRGGKHRNCFDDRGLQRHRLGGSG